MIFFNNDLWEAGPLTEEFFYSQVLGSHPPLLRLMFLLTWPRTGREGDQEQQNISNIRPCSDMRTLFNPKLHGSFKGTWLRESVCLPTAFFLVSILYYKSKRFLFLLLNLRIQREIQGPNTRV
jgi:hypothetical protein